MVVTSRASVLLSGIVLVCLTACNNGGGNATNSGTDTGAGPSGLSFTFGQPTRVQQQLAQPRPLVARAIYEHQPGFIPPPTMAAPMPAPQALSPQGQAANQLPGQGQRQVPPQPNNGLITNIPAIPSGSVTPAR